MTHLANPAADFPAKPKGQSLVAGRAAPMAVLKGALNEPTLLFLAIVAAFFGPVGLAFALVSGAAVLLIRSTEKR